MLTEQAINYIEIEKLKFIITKLCDKRLVLQTLTGHTNNSLVNDILRLNEIIGEINEEINYRQEKFNAI